MKTARLATLLAAAAIALLIHSPPAWSADPAKPESGQVNLTYEAGNAVGRLYTPVKVITEGRPLMIQGAKGKLSVGGEDVLVAARRAGADDFIGLDADGSGSIDQREWFVVKGRPITVDLKLPSGSSGKRDYSVTLIARVYLSGTTIVAIAGKYHVNCCRKGAINGTVIRIIDDNMDGRITQDGADAIAIGDSPVAVPLQAVHQVGGKFYKLQVAEDGSSLTAAPLSDVKLGAVETPFKTAALKCLVLTGKEGSFDVVTGGKLGIPAGEYRLAYGMLASGQEMLPIVPTQSALSYPIEADKLNVIRIGAPLKVDFMAGIAENGITVSPPLQVLGAGGEQYAADWTNRATQPHVLLMNGDRVLSDTPMSYG